METVQRILECLRNHPDILGNYGITSDDLYSAYSAVVESIAKQNQLKLRQLEWRRINIYLGHKRPRGRKSQKKCRKNRLAKRKKLIVQARINAPYPNPHLDWRETHIKTKGYDIHDLNSYSFNDILQLED
jgi:predicted alpha/beta superfamily hydrolase